MVSKKIKTYISIATLGVIMVTQLGIQMISNGSLRATKVVETKAMNEYMAGNDVTTNSVDISNGLKVVGTQLCDTDGNPIQLRGISTHGLAWYPGYVNQDCISQLHDEWGANVFRLAMYTNEYGGYCSGGDKEQLKQLVRDGVKYATNAGMYVIIDWHILSDGNPNTYKSEAKDFFAQMSKEFSSYNNIIYEICNEPNGGTSWSDIKSYAQEVIPVIRANDKDAVIIVGTPNWSQYVDQAAQDPIKEYDNIMYALHFYAATHTDSLRNTMVSAIKAGLPIFVSEYGICDASGNGSINEYQANQWIQTMNDYGVSYVAWNLSNKSETCAIIKSSCSKYSGFTQADLSDSGKWVYNMLTTATGAIGSPEVEEPEVEESEDTTTSEDSSNNSTNNDSNNNTGNNSGNNSGSSNNNDSGNNNNWNDWNTTGIALTNANMEVTPRICSSWKQGDQTYYLYFLVIKNTASEKSASWSIDINFNENIILSDGWCGDYAVNGSTLHIDSKDYNGTLRAGESLDGIGFIVCGSEGLAIQ